LRREADDRGFIGHIPETCVCVEPRLHVSREEDPMTAFCLSSTSRSRPVTFYIMASGGDDDVETVPEPVRTNLIVDTPEDEPADRPPTNDPAASPRPDAKHPSDQEHGRA
jgi:hypothetical protein